LLKVKGPEWNNSLTQLIADLACDEVVARVATMKK